MCRSRISTGSGPAVPSGSGFPDFGFFQKSSRTMGGFNWAYKGDFGPAKFLSHGSTLGSPQRPILLCSKLENSIFISSSLKWSQMTHIERIFYCYQQSWIFWYVAKSLKILTPLQMRCVIILCKIHPNISKYMHKKYFNNSSTPSWSKVDFCVGKCSYVVKCTTYERNRFRQVPGGSGNILFDWGASYGSKYS